MVYDPEYTTGLYQREPQTLWTVTSSSECVIEMHRNTCLIFLNGKIRHFLRILKRQATHAQSTARCRRAGSSATADTRRHDNEGIGLLTRIIRDSDAAADTCSRLGYLY